MIGSLDLPTLDARARGLGSRLFPRSELEHMAGAADVPALARDLDASARLYVPIGSSPTVPAIESAARHTAAHHLSVLSVWAGPGGALDVFYADADRRCLRALLRGALQGAPADARLAGLLSTPCLPERALITLSHQPTPAAIVSQLVLLHHPEADRLSALGARTQPVLLDLERALVRGFAERSLVAARAGDRNLRDVVRTRIDVCNAQMALAFTAGPRDVRAEPLFTDGGESLPRATFLAICAATSSTEARDRLERALGATALRRVAREASGDPSHLESALLKHTLVQQRHRARLAPLGSAPLVSFLLRLQTQSMDLQRLAWGISLGAPAELLRAGLVTPWT